MNNIGGIIATGNYSFNETICIIKEVFDDQLTIEIFKKVESSQLDLYKRLLNYLILKKRYRILYYIITLKNNIIIAKKCNFKKNRVHE